MRHTPVGRPVPTTYISTFKGNRFYPDEPRIDGIDIEDIAHGLAYQCRFNGQTAVFYSVAQHSLMVASLLPPALQKAALLHDAAEAYLGDVVKPLKRLLPAFSRIEAGVTDLIAQAFGVDFGKPPVSQDEGGPPLAEGCAVYRAIKRADLVALATEKRDLMPNSTEAWSYLSGIHPLPGVIQPLSPPEAKAAFLAAWAALPAPPTQGFVHAH
jgi:5'-deoxynucleotidase YfbR-like HD superfamily hydrolase